MAERIGVPEWRDELEADRYPFADTASLTSQDGFILPGDLFLDAAFYPVDGGVRLYLAQINISVALITLTLSDQTGLTLATGSFDPLHPGYQVDFEDAYGRPAGVLVTEPLRLSVLSTWPVGTHIFDLGATEFVAGVTIPVPATGLRGLLTEAGELLTGEVWLIGDNGVVVREEGGNVRIDLVGDPLFRRKLCSPISVFQSPNFLLTINGCTPNAYGDFQLNVGPAVTPDTILRIYPVADGLKVEAVGKPI